MTSSFIPLVRAGAIEALPSVLDRLSLSFRALSAQVGLPDIRMDRNDAVLPLREVLALVEAAARMAGRETLAIDIHRAAGGPGALGAYGATIAQAPTLWEAIRRANAYLAWHTLGATLALEHSGDSAIWRYDLLPAVREGRQHALLFAGLMMRDVVRLYAGPRWLPRQARIQTMLARTGELQDSFGDRIVFGTPGIALAIPEALLSRPRSGTPAFAAPAGADRDGPLAAPPPEFVGSLRLLIRSLLPSGYPDAVQVARLSHLPLRSFQRLLALAGLSFTELVNQTRFELALELMRDRRTSLTDVAFELAYSDPANFTRAFRRWTGVAPRVYQHRIAAVAPAAPPAA